MGNPPLPLPIPSIPSVATAFSCSRRAEPGERSGSSLPIRRRSRSALCLCPGPVSPFLIPFWLLQQGKRCFVLKTSSTSTRCSKFSRLTRRRITKMTQQITAHHLSRLAYLYVRQSTLQQVFENTESTARQYALRERALALGWSQ